jgi:hypothetical protein
VIFAIRLVVDTAQKSDENAVNGREGLPLWTTLLGVQGAIVRIW